PPRYHHKLIDEEYFEWLFSMLEGTGLTFLYRCNLAGRAYYQSKLMATFDNSCVNQYNPDAAIWYRLAEYMRGCDPFAIAVRTARRHGIKIFAWFNWNEFHNVRRDWVSLIDPVWFEKPRKFWCSRDGSRFYHGVPDFGDSNVQERLTGLAAEVMGYGVDGFYLSTRSHSWAPCWMGPGSQENMEPFGFNKSVVDAYYKKHGIDIRYEDYDTEQWHRIKGEHFSTLLAKTGAVIHQHNKPFIIGLVPDRYTLMGMGKQWAGRENIKLYKDWEGWIAEGSVDGICSEENCPHYKKIEPSNMSVFKDTVDKDFPLYTWGDTAWFVNRGAGPFSMGNWNRLTPDEVIGQIEMAKSAGAGGIFLHSMYHYTSIDSGGKFIGVNNEGYGILPRTEYFEKLREYSCV
ncbi:MAG: hypothetical protein ABIG61_09145, partial [Planctomycetota bacterium]